MRLCSVLIFFLLADLPLLVCAQCKTYNFALLDFTAQGCLAAENSVTFTVSGLQQPMQTSYNWDFGDGQTAQGSTVTNTYNGKYGYYCVKLSAANQCGTQDINKTIFVMPDPCACNSVVNYDFEDQSTLTDLSFETTTTIEGDVYVNQNCTIYMSTLKFGPKGRIIVKKGKVLTIDRSTLTALDAPCNNYLWQGIEVWGQWDASSLPANQGKVIFINGSLLEYAHIGVLLGARNTDLICDNSQTPFIAESAGGIIDADNTTFQNNGINIKFMPKQSAFLNAGTSSVKNCNFVGSNLSAKDPLYIWSDIYECYPNATNPYTQASSGGRTYMGIYIEQLKNLGSTAGLFNNTFTNMQYGIESANAKFDIYKCTFTDLEFGVFIHNYTSNVNVNHTIGNVCFFDRVQYGISILGGKNDIIQENDFGSNISFQSQNFCGILTHASSGFSILDNNFWNFSIGIRAMKSGSNGGLVTNSIRDKGNIFTSCRKSIETVSDNSELKIKCNTHYNSTGNYFKSWVNHGTLAPQGLPAVTQFEIANPAGNWFEPSNRKKLSSNYSYTYYSHNPVPYPQVVPDVSGTPIIPNVSTYGFDPVLSCPLNNTNQTVLMLETQFNQLNTSNSTLRLRFDSVVNILDRGQTTVLLSMIQGNTSEGQLKNKLITNSPLSDNVVSELISSNKLVPGNFKNVMSKNLPVTKTVEPAFIDKIRQLPPGIADQLIKLHGNNPGVVTLASIQRDLDRNNITQKEIMAELTKIYIDSGQTDKAIQLLETQNDAGSKQTLVTSLITENRLTEASTWLAGFVPADQDEQDWVTVSEILLSLQAQGKTIYDLNPSQITLLRSIANSCPAGLAAMNAQSVLRLVFNDRFIQCPDDTLSTARYSRNYENTSFSSLVDKEILYLGDNYPNPFSNKTEIPYCLSEGINAVLQIKDVHGRLLSEFVLKIGKNRLEIDTENWAAGVYYYSLVVNGETIENKKMILIK